MSVSKLYITVTHFPLYPEYISWSSTRYAAKKPNYDWQHAWPMIREMWDRPKDVIQNDVGFNSINYIFSNENFVWWD